MVIDAGDTLRLASYDNSDTILALSSGMALSGGQIRLLLPAAEGQAQEVQDMVGYGDAATFEGSAPAPAPQAGRSILRKQDTDNKYIDANDNAADFVLAEDSSAAATPVENAGRGAGGTYLAATITEVLPDPASPQLDSDDEFIELYNPYDQPLDLTGYTLKTGSTWHYSFTIDGLVVAPHEYAALTSADTRLTLSNSGSGVRLFDPAGTLLAEAPSYGKAKTGQSWALSGNNQWVWTTEATPGAGNVINSPAEAEATTAAAKTTKKAATTTKPKTTSAKTTKAPTSKTASNVKGASSPQAGQTATVQNAGSNNYWLLIAAGALAGGYALYEYRQEVTGFIRGRWQALTGGAG